MSKKLKDDEFEKKIKEFRKKIVKCSQLEDLLQISKEMLKNTKKEAKQISELIKLKRNLL
jgi:hypothetical protein